MCWKTDDIQTMMRNEKPVLSCQCCRDWADYLIENVAFCGKCVRNYNYFEWFRANENATDEVLNLLTPQLIEE